MAQAFDRDDVAVRHHVQRRGAGLDRPASSSTVQGAAIALRAAGAHSLQIEILPQRH
ncbi:MULTISPECIES: hypothetical protein [unclassified Tardiphaga]|uniref:hypothetical protein n=1 Tax=unclassified Tardiphaga TaxID=2631404 RepID=UPI00143DB4AB|nr:MULTISPECIES: hypothetical protein [unclassified Tardiphaga]